MITKEKTDNNNKSYFDSIKESGFYVGYDKKNRQWISPQSEHDEETFDSLFKLTNSFAENVKNWIFSDIIDKESVFEMLSSFDDKIINKNWLEKQMNTKKNERHNLES